MKKSVYIIAAIANLGILAVYAVPDKKAVTTESQSSGNTQEVVQASTTDNQAVQEQTSQSSNCRTKRRYFYW
jgi:hypothetical protein